MKREITLINDSSEIEKLSDFIEEIGDELTISPDLLYNLNLVLEEASVNIIQYAYGDKTQQEFTVEVLLTVDNYLQFTLTDRGIPFDPTQYGPSDVSGLEARPEDGLGIFLIKSIMDNLEYHRRDDQNIFIMRKKIR